MFLFSSYFFQYIHLYFVDVKNHVQHQNSLRQDNNKGR